jgi:hypothetical protein
MEGVSGLSRSKLGNLLLIYNAGCGEHFVTLCGLLFLKKTSV